MRSAHWNRDICIDLGDRPEKIRSSLLNHASKLFLLYLVDTENSSHIEAKDFVPEMVKCGSWAEP